MSILSNEGFRGRGLNYRKKGLRLYMTLVATFLLGAEVSYCCENNDWNVVHTYIQPNGPGEPWNGTCQNDDANHSGDNIFWDLPIPPYKGIPTASPLATTPITSLTTSVSYWFSVH